MKRDSESVSDGGGAQSQLAVIGNSSRFKGAILNGVIVYTRARRRRVIDAAPCEAEADVSKNDERINDCDGGGDLPTRGFESDQMVEVAVRDERSGDGAVEVPNSRKSRKGKRKTPFSEDRDGELVEVLVRDSSSFSLEMIRDECAALNGSTGGEGSGSRKRRRKSKSSEEKSLNRKHQTRSAMKLAIAKPPVENISQSLQVSDDVAVSEVVQETEFLPVSEDVRVLEESMPLSEVVPETEVFPETEVLPKTEGLRETGALVVAEAVPESEVVPAEVTSDVEEEKLVAMSTLLWNSKLELKMSKKVVLDRKPTTVKELFDTGLVDGITVIYMGSKKAFGLRGTIRDGGILCYCVSCNGCRVVPPSQFEIHACKTYRRAAQYICFANGRSLLDLLKVCRNASLHTLEATIQKFINSSPIDTYLTCQKCSVSFPPYCAVEDGSLCYSCMEAENPGWIPSKEASRSLRALLPASPKTATYKYAKNGISKTPKSTILRPPIRAISKSPKSTFLDSPKTAILKLTNSALAMSPKSASLWTTTKSSTPVSISSPSESTYPVRSDYTGGWNITSKSQIDASLYFSSQKKSHWRITTKDQRLHKLVFEEGGLPDGSEVAYYARGQKLLVGYKKGLGIFCRCCNTEVSPSQFEAHAGWATRRKAYAYIYTSNGVSLHELAISLSRGRKYSAKDNDDLCVICADGGNLVLCDGCPRAFHRDCASLSGAPRGKWYCRFCQDMFRRENFVKHNENAVAAGRVEGIDPIEEITQRCIRIVKDIEAELTGCVLCRGYDFSKSGFGPRTIILCDQCEKEYHVGCLKKHKMANLKELPKGKWFCCPECSQIQIILQKCLSKGTEELPESHMEIMKRKHEANGLDIVNGFDVRWRLISGKMASHESRSLLAKAVAIFHDCFDPIVDAESGRDLIPAMVYGRNVRSQEFGGMYCAILMVNSTIVSAAIIRVFGQEVAEIPLVATSSGNHGKGYFRSLFSCFEKLLAFLSVKNLVLPAAPEAESIWTEKFGFTRIDPDQLINYRRTCYQMITFKGTSMLHKKVPECRRVNTAC